MTEVSKQAPTGVLGALGALELDEDALRVAAMCADDVFDTPEDRHVEQARRFVAAYLTALGEGTPPPPRQGARVHSEFVWPSGI